jgi:hypothetical protein
MADMPDMDLLVTAADNPDQITLPAAKDVRVVWSTRFCLFWSYRNGWSDTAGLASWTPRS